MATVLARGLEAQSQRYAASAEASRSPSLEDLRRRDAGGFSIPRSGSLADTARRNGLSGREDKAQRHGHAFRGTAGGLPSSATAPIPEGPSRPLTACPALRLPNTQAPPQSRMNNPAAPVKPHHLPRTPGASIITPSADLSTCASAFPFRHDLRKDSASPLCTRYTDSFLQRPRESSSRL
eukprot:CAMPEP_0196661552 /NCGR_PEP_ID=MMETSP1086-20130531/44857_1 /TAXON_ID=77921 /ORGANISM="Cyanoptyche  gloeocystis , Strain SAG4.97" /LENGTH=179 /DNA_ID=CAMNT_0041996503 /DNA_START=230 /DNA_END=769 /DNA_ORIENTATION=-